MNKLLKLMWFAAFAIGNSNQTQAAGDAEQGAKIYNAPAGCNICHGKDAVGAYGPRIQGADLKRVEFALSAVDDMILWQSSRAQPLTQQDKENLAAYLATRAGMVADDEELIPEQVKDASLLGGIRQGVMMEAGEELGDGFVMGKGMAMK